ncbi:methyltransferase domain-containing protein [Chloroflexota bacterium]
MMKLAICVFTQPEVVKVFLGLAQIKADDIVCDLGCGDGRLLISAVNDYGAQKAIGYEMREDLCISAREEIRNLQLQDRIEIVHADLLEADLSNCSVVTIYLSNEANELLRIKLQEQLKPGSRVVCYSYPINSWNIAEEVRLQDLNQSTKKFMDALYLYHIPEAYTSRFHNIMLLTKSFVLSH